MTKIANFDHRSPPKMQVCAGENAWHCKKYSPLVTKVVAVFAFCCLGVGAKKCCPGEVTVHVIKALASRTHLASTHPLLHLHCTDLKRHCSSGNRCPKYWPNGALRSPTPSCFVSSSFVSCCPIGWLTGRGLCRRRITHIRSGQLATKTQNMFSSHPRHSDDHTNQHRWVTYKQHPQVTKWKRWKCGWCKHVFHHWSTNCQDPVSFVYFPQSRIFCQKSQPRAFPARRDSDKNPLWENDRFGRLLHLTGKSMFLWTLSLGFQPLIFSS